MNTSSGRAILIYYLNNLAKSDFNKRVFLIGETKFQIKHDSF